MLGSIAAVVLVVGTISATASVVQTDREIIEHAGEPVVEVQEVESMDSASE